MLAKPVWTAKADAVSAGCPPGGEKDDAGLSDSDALWQWLYRHNLSVPLNCIFRSVGEILELKTEVLGRCPHFDILEFRLDLPSGAVQVLGWEQSVPGRKSDGGHNPHHRHGSKNLNDRVTGPMTQLHGAPPSTRGQYFCRNGDVKANLPKNGMQPWLLAGPACSFLCMSVKICPVKWEKKPNQPFIYTQNQILTNMFPSGIVVAGHGSKATNMSKVKTALEESMTLNSYISAPSWTKNSILLWAFALLLGACNPNKETPPPAEIIGTYKTNDPRYEGLYFRIAKDSFDFSTAEGTVENYTLVTHKKLEKTNNRRKMLYRLLHGKREGHELKVSFSYEPAGGGSLSFLNRPTTIWVREEVPAQ